ncbi:SRPBCC family protein [Geodermatophilus sp. SYSU D00691]
MARPPLRTAFTASRTLDVPADRVWHQLTDWPAAAGWLGVDAIRAEGPTAVGTALTFTARGRERRSEIVALDPGRSLTLRSVQGGVTADYRYSVEPADGGSRLELVADVGTRGPWGLLAPVIRAAIRRQDAGQLDALARAVGQRLR